MDITLLVLTGASLVAALVFGTALWRLAREERSRSRARVAALATASREADENLDQMAAPLASGRSRRSEDFQDDWTLPSHVAPAPRRDDAPLDAISRGTDAIPGAAPMADSFLRGTDYAAPDHRQRSLAFLAAALLVVFVGAGAWFVRGSPSTPLPPRTVTSAAPVELVSLGHERLGTKLAVAGVVRNPVAGRAIERLAAVVFLFDEAGTSVTSGQALVDFLSLGPGEESPFVVEVEAPRTVTRYRVSFRTDDGVVAHVDRRVQSPVAPASFERPASRGSR